MTEATKSSMLFTTVGLFGSFLPLIIVALVRVAGDSTQLGLFDVVSHGQALIVCISLLVTASVTLYYYKHEIGETGWHDVVFWISFVLIIADLIIYVVLSAIVGPPNAPFVMVVSGVGIGWTMVALYSAQRLQNLRTDIVRERSDQAENLADKARREREAKNEPR